MLVRLWVAGRKGDVAPRACGVWPPSLGAPLGLQAAVAQVAYMVKGKKKRELSHLI